jgi:fumarylpyruvate hydrolase
MSVGQGALLFPAPEGARVPVQGTEALFPVHRVYCVGRNYAEHAREMGATEPEPPFFFAKPADAVCTASRVPYPPATADLQHEVELVAALGAGGANVPPERAMALVFGYAVGVDLTRRDLQAAAKARGRPWTTAKGFDHSAPISPIRPAGACGDPAAVRLRLTVNGELRQEGSTADMIWPLPAIIAELSRYFDLQPGDLIFTGTPAGVGPLQPDDRVDCSAGGIADLAFTIAPATY